MDLISQYQENTQSEMIGEYTDKKLKKKLYMKVYNERNKEKIKLQSRERNRKYRIESRDKALATSSRYYHSHKEIVANRVRENVPKYLWRSCLDTSRKKGYDFNIEVEDIIIPEVCPYLNEPITSISGKKFVPTNPSVDRIDSTKGYVKGNIQVISRQANIMKSNASKSQLLIFAKNILRLHSDY